MSTLTVVLLVGTAKGAFVFTSDLERRSWQCRGPLLPGWQLYDLLALPGTQRLLAATNHLAYGATVRVSDDFGMTWQQQARSPRYSPGSEWKVREIWRFSQPDAAAAPDQVYAGVADAGLFLSRDAGESWAEVDGLHTHPTRSYWDRTAGSGCLHSIVVDPADSDRRWVAVSGAGVFRTDDAGASWVASNEGLPPPPPDHPSPAVGRQVQKLAIDPRPPHPLYLQHHSGVFRSADGARSWERIDAGLPTSFGFPIAVDRTRTVWVAPLEGPDNRYMRAGRLALYRSPDAGGSWVECRQGLPDVPHYVSVLRDALTTDDLDPVGVYFGTTSGELYASADGGDTWHNIPGTFTRITSIRACLLDLRS
ncbi:WD40/YVTN/BNR-like repeat-containing protein [Actinopolymorpha alba]|uniref:WD40/YVTN/BNR-like repeat-containing protein n=1 Tax=Actinopolymorpha alba TaxID=533267 RepID=UPI00039A738F|nr:exo-alpha-sialidase [Actinopolymorpha alba]